MCVCVVWHHPVVSGASVEDVFSAVAPAESLPNMEAQLQKTLAQGFQTVSGGALLLGSLVLAEHL